MDPVSQFYASLPDPPQDRVSEVGSMDKKIEVLLQNLVNDRREPDTEEWKFIHKQASQALKSKRVGVMGFQQQLASYAVDKAPNRKDKSARATQLRYYKWIAQGRKNETYPFANGRFLGQPSTTRIAQVPTPEGVLHSCASCKKPGSANLRCPVCDLSTDKYVLDVVAYCNKTCLQNHLAKHQQVCKGRRLIVRATKLLEGLFLRMIAATFHQPLKSSREHMGMLIVDTHSWEKFGMVGRQLFVDVSGDLIVGETEAAKDECRRAVLCLGQEPNLATSLFEMINYLFSFAKHVGILYAIPINMKRPMIQEHQGKYFHNSFTNHPVLIIQLWNNDKYVIDLTSSQFGWPEVLSPAVQWCALRTMGDMNVKNLTKHWPRRDPDQDLRSMPFYLIERDAGINVMAAMVTDLQGVVRKMKDSYRTITDLLAEPDHELYAQYEHDMFAIFRGRVKAMIIDVYHRSSQYRLFLAGAPSYSCFCAGDQSRALKDIWMKEAEYERLKAGGGDIREQWELRLIAKLQ
ncbi:hypothetical protein F5Y17DRAFT_55486 [Xylariaceae sp. FL0594]|nr:hypothetical protein F5Y17DRAFT_55486 [Xylariaceae sp. FL0594]